MDVETRFFPRSRNDSARGYCCEPACYDCPLQAAPGRGSKTPARASANAPASALQRWDNSLTRGAAGQAASDGARASCSKTNSTERENSAAPLRDRQGALKP